MDVAEKLLDELLLWAELQEKGATKLKDLATEMEERRKTVNVSKVVGSSVSVGGAMAVTAAGVLTVFTGGLATPLLVAGAVATGAGLVTNVSAEIVDAVKSSDAMKEAEEVSEKIKKAEKKIQSLMKTLKDEQEDDQLPADNYVMEQILRVMARRKGLILPDVVILFNILSVLPSFHLSGDILRLISSFFVVFGLQVVLAAAAKETGKKAAASVAFSIGGKVAAKAAGCVSIKRSCFLPHH